eukprot:1158798-Pelagomonas_calceolata.AAC.3
MKCRLPANHTKLTRKFNFLWNLPLFWLCRRKLGGKSLHKEKKCTRVCLVRRKQRIEDSGRPEHCGSPHKSKQVDRLSDHLSRDLRPGKPLQDT